MYVRSKAKVAGRHRNQHRRPGPNRTLAPVSAAHRKLLLPIEPEEPLGLRDLQPAELRFPFVDAGVADAVFAAQIGDRNAASYTIKIPIIYSSEKRLRFMLWSSSWARANFNLD
jgi:hypothetical protein